MESDELLHERLRRGDLAAFDALYARYERRLFGFLLAFLRDPVEAEDAFHETFLGVLRGREVDLSRGSFRSWLYQVARNHCLNRLRARERGERAARLIAAAPVATQATDEKIAGAQAVRALSGAVSRLPATLAELYHLRAAGMSYEEMARVLDVPLGTVKSRMHEMIDQLRKEMRPWSAG
jgi:RNA polymerase sigma-70 factor (ECF subfamily)